MTATGGEEGEPDPHFWLDPIMVKTYVGNIRDGWRPKTRPAARVWRNAEAYQAELGRARRLDRSQVERSKRATPLVTNHESLGSSPIGTASSWWGTLLPGVSSGASLRQDLAKLEDDIRRLGVPAIILERALIPNWRSGWRRIPGCGWSRRYTRIRLARGRVGRHLPGHDAIQHRGDCRCAALTPFCRTARASGMEDVSTGYAGVPPCKTRDHAGAARRSVGHRRPQWVGEINPVQALIGCCHSSPVPSASTERLWACTGIASPRAAARGGGLALPVTLWTWCSWGATAAGLDETSVVGRRGRGAPCLERLGIERFEGRPIADLSGGEQQRVFWLGRWAEPHILLMASPSTASMWARARPS